VALLVSAWKQARDKGMDTLISRGTWEFVSTPIDAVIVGCRRVFN